MILSITLLIFNFINEDGKGIDMAVLINKIDVDESNFENSMYLVVGHYKNKNKNKNKTVK